MAQKQTAAAHNDGQLRQWPFDAGDIATQFGQFAFDGRGGCAGGQQLGQATGGGDFLKIEVRQAADFAGGMDQSATVPAADHRHRDVEQLGEHGRRIQAADMMFFIQQTEPLPEFAFADHFDIAGFDGGLRGGVEQDRRRWRQSAEEILRPRQ